MLLMIKIVRKCKIVCLCREGLEDFDDPLIVDKRLGGYTFSDKIIDYIFYWGEKPRKIMGNAMIKNIKFPVLIEWVFPAILCIIGR